MYVFQSGLVLNAFGNGAANPFLVIYLHDVRGIPLALAGLAGSTSALFGLGATLAAGSISDRLGARTAMLGGLALSAIGFSLFRAVCRTADRGRQGIRGGSARPAVSRHRRAEPPLGRLDGCAPEPALPGVAHERSGVSTHAIGVLFLLNSLTIVVLQLPVARLVEGHRRMRALALMAAFFGCWWLLVLVAGVRLTGGQAVLLFGVAIGILAVGECLYDSVQGPLVAELAPEGATGRYLAVSGFSWQLGFILAPAAGGALLGAEPLALPVVAASICAIGAAGALALEGTLPERARRTPRLPERELPERLQVGGADADEA